MRIELIHPMLVHFPLGLLLTGAALKLAGFFLKKSRFYPNIRIASLLLLTIGVVFAWITILAGEFAIDIVKKNLCDKQVVENHSLLGYTAAIFFTVAVILDWVRVLCKRGLSSSLMKVATVVTSLGYFAGVSLLIVVGWLGGNLVYDQGAAVEKLCEEADAAPRSNSQ